MRPGSRRTYFRIYRMVPGRDDMGGVVNVPVVFREAWARFEPLAARELFTGGIVLTEADHRATFEALDVEEVTTEMRVVDEAKDRIYDITAVRELDVRETELILRRRVE